MNETLQQLTTQKHDAADQAREGRTQSVRQKQNNIIAEGFRNHTKGEALFNKISYVGFGYFLTTAVSIAMTWALNDTKQFSKTYKKVVAPKISKLGIPESFTNIVSLFIGGSIASVLPVKWLEDSKPKLVRKFDHLYYTDDQIANDPNIQAAYRTLDAEPKQTWLSVFGSRVVAFAATFSIFSLMGSNDSVLAKKAGESIDKRSIQFGRWFDKSLAKLGRNGAEVATKIEAVTQENAHAVQRGELHGLEVIRENQLEKSPNHPTDRIRSRIWNYIAMDAFYTAITSSTLFVFTRILGPVFAKSKSAENPAPKVTAAEVTPAKETAAPEEAKTKSIPAQPTTSVTQTTHQLRVASPSAEHALNA